VSPPSRSWTKTATTRTIPWPFPDGRSISLRKR
jgi:hypothetical protein